MKPTTRLTGGNVSWLHSYGKALHFFGFFAAILNGTGQTLMPCLLI